MLAIKSDDLFKINFAEALLLVLSNATDLISHNLIFGGRDTENQASDYITNYHNVNLVQDLMVPENAKRISVSINHLGRWPSYKL